MLSRPLCCFHRRVLILAISVISYVLPGLATAAEIPGDREVIRRLSSTSFPHIVHLLNWNVKKAEEDGWAAEMKEFSAGRNLVTLQEGYEIPLMTDTLKALPGLSFYMAGAFVYRGSMTGVITGSAAEPSRKEFRRSPGLEPILNSPKMTSLSYFKMNDDSELLVANLHGLNFVSIEKFQEQIRDVASVLAQHSGPMIFAGDFNTWNPARTEILAATAKQLGLEEVSFGTSENKKAALDHVFVKGCVILKAWMPEKVKGSDHLPQFADLKCGSN